MSLYNLLFGMNPHSDLLLAVIGLRKNDIERFRDVYVSEDGKTITVHTRTGGGNREDYPNLTMRKLPMWRGSHDEEFDNTYADDHFTVPDEWVEDVKGLNDILGNGIRKEFGQHLLVTLRREPTESDQRTAAHEKEEAELKRTRHFRANGHTFVPMDDSAMETALKLAEANGGELRSAWGIFPMRLTIKTNEIRWPNAKAESDRLNLNRAEIGYDHKWTVDEDYWKHCQDRWANTYPVTMAKITEQVEGYRKKAA
jgi:hypothetical protein